VRTPDFGAVVVGVEREDEFAGGAGLDGAQVEGHEGGDVGLLAVGITTTTAGLRDEAVVGVVGYSARGDGVLGGHGWVDNGFAAFERGGGDDGACGAEDGGYGEDGLHFSLWSRDFS